MGELEVNDILDRIYFIRGEKVMLDKDIASLFEVDTKVLKQAVRRNITRFPSDFMFELTDSEQIVLRSQFVTSKGRGGERYNAFAFTEQGIAMLSSVLRSEKAIQVNISIMRAFVKMRRVLDGYKELSDKLQELEGKFDKQFSIVFKLLKQFIKEETERVPIGYKLNNKNE
jgi:chromosome condensin MukBEF ATPase and DNA-binding subunit MukB